ncbi:helix-turn-helix domain-containing protein [Streptomyces sp. NPDC057717]|uniref:helix-turn-helix domain-containing protein n=1 Tax=Streptomyces sp. NPDC057717 TaxID=3346224 RepID=UPI0036A5BA86
MPNTCVAADLKVTAATVRKWRSRFAAHRLEGLMDVPRPGRRKVDLVLSEAERSQLMRWARRAKTAQFLALRARIVLRCAEGGTNKQVAAELDVGEQSVNRWRARLVKQRLDGLIDEPRPRRPHIRQGPGRRHQSLDRHLEQQPQAVHLEQDRRRDPQIPRRLPQQDRSHSHRQPARHLSLGFLAHHTSVSPAMPSPLASCWNMPTVPALRARWHDDCYGKRGERPGDGGRGTV